MHAVLATFVAAEEIDPATVRPVPLSAVVFTILLVVLLLLLRSFMRHLRRVDANLGPAKQVPGAAGGPPGSRGASAPSGPTDDRPPAAGGTAGRSGTERSTPSGAPGQVEGDSL